MAVSKKILNYDTFKEMIAHLKRRQYEISQEAIFVSNRLHSLGVLDTELLDEFSKDFDKVQSQTYKTYKAWSDLWYDVTDYE